MVIDIGASDIIERPSSLVHFHPFLIQTVSLPVPDDQKRRAPAQRTPRPDRCPARGQRVTSDDQAAFSAAASIIFVPSTTLVAKAGLLSTAMRRGFIASGNSRSRSTCRTPSAMVAPTTFT